MRIIEADGIQEMDFFREMKKRAEEISSTTDSVVREIIEQVCSKGDEAVRNYGIAFDGSCPDEFDVSQEEMKKAFDEADKDFRTALLNAKDNITQYHEKQCTKDYEIRREKGIRLGLLTRGMNRVGIYVPGGTAAYPSTVLMNAIPARLAGVKEIIMVTPRASSDILCAAYIAGVNRVLLAGGAQAIAALALGTETFPKVDKIVGPGNIYVATAKKLLYGCVDIDMIAGPSEILIMADGSANPEFIAADLMSQAEHDVLAASVLLTTSRKIAEETKNEIRRQLEVSPRRHIIEESIKNHGAIIVCSSKKQMISLANEIAPEHLEIMTEDSMDILQDIRNAGSVFCGDFSPEPLGDYYAGTNHVLPTSGTSRFASPLGVYSFVKRMSYTYYSKEALEDARKDITEIAAKEGLYAHKNSIDIRFEKDGK